MTYYPIQCLVNTGNENISSPPIVTRRETFSSFAALLSSEVAEVSRESEFGERYLNVGVEKPLNSKRASIRKPIYREDVTKQTYLG